MIDIIIEDSNKSLEEAQKTISSICYQLEMPKVYIHSKYKLPEEVIQKYKKFVMIENGTQNIKGNYLMFIEVGDCFASPFALNNIQKYSGYDIVAGNCIEKGKNNKEMYLTNSKDNSNGKIYNIEFLKNNKIDINNKIMLHHLSMMFLPNIYYMEEENVLYINSSIKQKEYITNIKEVIKKGLELGKYIETFELSTKTLIKMYHKMLNNQVEIDLKELKEIYSIYKKYKDLYVFDIKEIDDNLTIKDLAPEISFIEFLEKIEKS